MSNDHIPPSLHRFISELAHPGNQQTPPGILGNIQGYRDLAKRELAHAGPSSAPRWRKLYDALEGAFSLLQDGCDVAAKPEPPAESDDEQPTTPLRCGNSRGSLGAGCVLPLDHAGVCEI